jgi:hypothetical protein
MILLKGVERIVMNKNIKGALSWQVVRYPVDDITKA